MKPRPTRFIVVLVAAATLGYLASIAIPQNIPPLKVIFPLRVLRPEPALLHPENTETTYEYYLLENLGVGLVRDDADSPTGYRGLLADHWFQSDPRTWVFTLRKDSRWSDGSPLTGEQLVAHFEQLKRRKSRHLVNLATLEKASFDGAARTLTLRFAGTTNESVLHELSLADAVVVHSCGDWSVTSGPYTVAAYRPPDRYLELRSNSHCPLISSGSPQRVVLTELVHRSELGTVFASGGADLYSLPVLYFAQVYAAVRKSAASHKVGRHTLIYFFQMNPKNPATKKLAQRQLLAGLLAEAFRDFRIGDDFAYYNQLIPSGYRGGLSDYAFPPLPAPTSVPTTKIPLVLEFAAAFRETLAPLNRLRALGEKYGIAFEFRFNAFDSAVPEAADEFARMNPFKGNQKDPVGSWSFLFSEGTGSLSPFRDEGLPLLTQAIRAENERGKSEALARLHRFVLDGAMVIPILSQREQVLASRRVNLDRWNPFDLRLRFYEVAWK